MRSGSKWRNSSRGLNPSIPQLRMRETLPTKTRNPPAAVYSLIGQRKVEPTESYLVHGNGIKAVGPGSGVTAQAANQNGIWRVPRRSCYKYEAAKWNTPTRNLAH